MINVTKGYILNLASDAATYAAGLKMFEEGEVFDVTEYDDNGVDVVSALVQGANKQYGVYIVFDEEGGVKSYRCACSVNNIWRGACKHVVAVLFSCVSGFGTHNASFKYAKRFTDEFEKVVYNEIDSQLRQITIPSSDKYSVLPSLTLSQRNELRLGLKVGRERFYVVKDIGEFLTNVNFGRTHSYGAKCSFNHSLGSFDEQSATLIRFLIEMFKDYEYYTKSYGDAYYAFNRNEFVRHIIINARNLDKLFDLYKGKRLPYTRETTGDDKEILLTDDMSKQTIRFNVAHENDTVTFTCERYDYDGLNGHEYSYIILDDFMLRLERQYANALFLCLNTFTPLDGRKIIFRGADLSRFMTFVYPRLKECGLLGDIKGDFSRTKSDTFTAQMYFDYADKTAVCKLLYKYGDDLINPLAEQPTGYHRDLASEYRVSKQLSVYGFEPDKKSGVYKLKGEDNIFHFFTGGIEDLKQIGEPFVTDELVKKITRPTRKTRMSVTLGESLLSLSLDECDYSIDELMQALEAYNTKKNYHRLKDGRFLIFDDESLNETLDIMSSLGLTKKDVKHGAVEVPKYRALYLDKMTRENENVTRDAAFNKLTEDFADVSQLEFELPPSLANVLRSYQKTGFNWLNILAHYGFGGILADDMGLGKTLQVISVLLRDKGKQNLPSIVVAPTSLIFNWEKEIMRFAPELKATVLSGTPQRRAELLETPGTDVYITTYDMLKRDIENFEKKEFLYVIADEAQNIKNPVTQNATSVKALRGQTRFALTGTPIENSLSELWSLFDFIMPGYLYTHTKFSTSYETPIVKNDDKEQAERLKKQIAPFILRRLKSDVLKELPEKTETTLYAEMLPEQRKLYMANLMKAKGELDEMLHTGGYAKSQIRILSLLTRLRQLCCHPALFIEDYKGGSGKLDLAVETVTTSIESGHRALVFSQFTSMLDILKKSLDANGVQYFYLDGATPAKDRGAFVERFNAGERDIFLISLKAGGTGLNLTGADVVIHFDQWWNPAVMDQASDRAHRLGQKKAVQVFNIVAKDSIEEKIILLQEKKKDLVDKVITEGASFINKMSQDEVMELFTD